MKGILFKQYNVWKVEYDEVKNNKILKKEIELHPFDVEKIDDDDGEYMNNYEFKEIFFDIVLFPDKYKLVKPVAKVIDDETPKPIVNKILKDDE